MFQDAFADFRAGRIDAAEGRCSEILGRVPSDHRCLNLLGTIALHRKKNDLARDFVQRALTFDPLNASYHGNLATILKGLGQSAEAELHYLEALRLKPDQNDVYHAYGNMLRELGRFEEAMGCFRKLIAVKPDDALAYACLANILQDRNQGEEAESHYRTALRLNPTLQAVLVNLGILLQTKGQHEESEACYRKALRLSPNMPEAHNNLGNLLREQARALEAEAFCREALRLRPNYPSAHNNLANALRELDRYQDAEEQYRKALRLRPVYPEGYNNLGTLLLDRGCCSDAIACYREAIRLKPDYADAHRNLGMALLLAGEFADGWQRFDDFRKSANRSDLEGPRWRGEELGDRVLLIYAEQGFGDTIQFCRLIPLIGRRARIVFEAQPQLVRLLSKLPGIEKIVGTGEPLPAYDLHCPLLSLPRVLDVTLETISAEIPYVSADPLRVAHWRDRLQRLAGLRVGLAWAGNPSMAADRRRSITADRLAVLGQVPGVSFVSLQKDSAAQLSSLPPGMIVDDWTSELHDFAETAALIEALDLVISVDTAVVHLAGALGKPVWLLNRFNCCWRWLLNRDDSPWYPTLRQFRQPIQGDWDTVIQAAKTALAQIVARRDARS